MLLLLSLQEVTFTGSGPNLFSQDWLTPGEIKGCISMNLDSGGALP